MVVDSLEASLRYPMDFTFHLQNFSALNYVKTVKSKQQATVAYSFIPADAFAGRPIGLTVNLHYRDAAGNFFIDPVFNETIQIVEFDEGFDTETFFMYVCIFGLAVLCLFLGFNYLSGKLTHCGNLYIFTVNLFQARKVVPDLARSSRPGLTAVTLTLSGSPSPISGRQAPGRRVRVRESPRIMLVQTQTNTDFLNKDSDLQQAQTVYDQLSVNGHEIWISDLTFCLDLVLSTCAGFCLFSRLSRVVTPADSLGILTSPIFDIHPSVLSPWSSH